MRETVERLVRLQDLEFARTEQRTLGDERGASILEIEIDMLRERLPRSLSTLFAQLRERNLAAVVPVHHGACSACGVALPTAQIGAVAAGKEIQQCRNCRRILYTGAEAPGRAQVPSSAKPSTDGPARFSSPALMLPEIEEKNSTDALREMIARMVEVGVADDAPGLLEKALAREQVASTALRQGLAFPHIRGIEGGGTVFALGTRSDGIDFGKAQRVSIVVLTIIPAAASGLYLTLVRDLLGIFREEAFRKRLLSCKTPATLWQTLRAGSKRGAASAASDRNGVAQSK